MRRTPFICTCSEEGGGEVEGGVHMHVGVGIEGVHVCIGIKAFCMHMQVDIEGMPIGLEGTHMSVKGTCGVEPMPMR